jgi:FtsP/CotA-like multicopper oxidase with cupredoxin domain
MRAMRNTKIRAWLALVVASTGLAVLTGPLASAAPVAINLCASDGQITMPGGVTVPVWGFVQTDDPCQAGLVDDTNFPGPVLSVDEADVVTIEVENGLPPGHTISFEIPGVAFDPGPTDAVVGATVSRTFTANAPGTYLYQSGGDAGRQEAMGLYGALIVRSGTAGQAYDDASTAYDVEATLVLSAIDPAFNAAPDTFDLNDYLATYWLINGKAYPDTAPIAATAGQRVLLRYLNAGYDNTSMMLLGMHQRVLARDAYLRNNPFDASVETIPAGGTEDAIATVPSYAPPSAHGFPLFNRNLHVTNGSSGNGTYATPGGMMTFIQP